ncbi:zincin-like metallopeptidase domain-containing protein [Bacillus sp. 37MA]|uniref:ArdC family protein n=1 Tax=Bacillus sp. 37MA TaxID=1132442 RepID=UPI0003757169|nr:zincin-like metallopeptidase domain-containing protein [Bacillus sp. 37MA]
MSKKIYEMVTNQIIEQLEKGVVPWHLPWINGGAVNWVTQKSYRGINAFLLPPGEYATFKQISHAGGKVKKGSKGSIVVFWKWIETEDKETGDTKDVPFLRYYKVFEINTQVEGLESKRTEETSFDHEPLEAAEQIVKGYETSPFIRFQPGRTVYYPEKDEIQVPPLTDFKQPERFYSTLFHEMIHSSGHKSRLSRTGITKTGVAFGDESYSQEELVAELGAQMLCGIAGIENHTVEQSASYIQSWLRALRDDTKMIVQAAAQAQKAADYILNVSDKEETVN